MIVTKLKRGDGAEIEQLIPENAEDLAKLNEMLAAGEVDPGGDVQSAEAVEPAKVRARERLREHLMKPEVGRRKPKS